MASKYKKARELAANLKAKLAPTVKSTAMAVGGGAIAPIAFGVAADRIRALQSKPYIEPALYIALGHMLRKKNPELGFGLIGAGGYALSRNMRFDITVRGVVAQNFGVAASAPASQAKGYGDAGALDSEYVTRLVAQAAGREIANRQLGQGDAGAYYTRRDIANARANNDAGVVISPRSSASRL